jgi:23S rRNA (cytosine1962-C5)-methyltransferase
MAFHLQESRPAESIPSPMTPKTSMTPQTPTSPAHPRRPKAKAATPPRASKAVGTARAAIVTRRAADRLRAGHPWVYASDVVEITGEENSDILPGLIAVSDQRGIPLGTALHSPSSQIALRLVSRNLLATDAEWVGLIETRLRRAIALRSTMQTEACRLVFSEADELPGLIVDRYGSLVLLQVLARGLDRPEVRELVTRILVEELAPETIVERGDARIAALEGLETPALATLYARNKTKPTLETTFLLNGLRFAYDAASGQKTGAFLDQRLNYAAAAEYAHGEALDVCTYQGGFALHMAQRCTRVTGVDSSRSALEVAERNLEANRSQLTAEVDWVEADAFELLRAWSDAGTQYDTIVLDPPAFAKSKRAVEGALRGYKELNLRALKMLRPGGVLVTCSCSHHISAADFTATVAAAASDAGRRVRLLERRGAAPDHPVVLTIPETEYLKCLICAAD